MMRHSIMRGPAPYALLLSLAAGTTAPSASDWPAYGRDAGGSRYSPLARITRENVAGLEVAWTYHTGEAGVTVRRGRPPALEATPLVVDGTMYLSTPLGRAIALDPATGRERWRYDPGVDPDRGYGDFASRGVAHWRDGRAPAGAACARRIFLATIDARLIAVDAGTGRPCAGFGAQGVVDLRRGLRVPPFEFSAYEMTSPPAVIGDLVVAGSAIADNSRLAPASGEVRAFDARTGALRWSFDPIPQDASDPASATWRDGSAARTGGANVWSVIVADPERDLVFLPTSSAAPDYFGGRRLGENRYANSVVALRGSTGRLVWHFQTVHHDLWDLDNAAPPALTTVVKAGERVPAVVQATKSGMVFILHRETGEPLFPVDERPVPRSDVPGEEASPTQPFTTVTPPLSPHRFTADDAWGPTPAARAWCREQMAALRNEGPFTPPSLQGTLVLPSNIGGAHWGGVAADETRRIVVVPVNRLAAMVQLLHADGFDRAVVRKEDGARGLSDFEYTRMEGTPFVMRRRLLMGPAGLPCTPPPWGALVAVSLETGRILWDVPLGTMPVPPGASPAPADLGSPNLGGPIATASGLVFIGATLDRAIRAFDIETGRQLWRAPLPAGARATPMTYEAGGRQFVAIAAGGGGLFGTGDAIMAFALPNAR
jgi:quinoprotein glucose dehydrogenase